MSLLGVRSLAAGSSRTICHRQTPLIRPGDLGRRWNTSEPTRRPIGRITPKRIAVRIRRPPSDEEGIPSRSIWRPIVFCLALGGGGYIGAAWYTNRDTDHWTARLRASTWFSRGRGALPTDREIMRAKVLEDAKSAQKKANALSASLSWLPDIIRTPLIRLYVLDKEWELNTPASVYVPTALIVYMGGVFVLWRSRNLQPWMQKWFLHRPVVFGPARQKWQECVTLFTSTISHQSLPHFAFNSIALYSFGSAAYAYLASPPPDSPRLATSTHTPHFLAFLLAAGLFSSLSSHLFTNLVRLPRLVRSLQNPARLSLPSALAVQQGIVPSLGASGAIYAAVTLTACAYPDTGVALIFIPFFSIPIGLGVSGMVIFDILGLIRGWKVFDHVAHLGGAVFGLVYYKYGRQIWNSTRRELMELEEEA